MSTNHTTNYQLSQWEPTDQVLRADFNEDNEKIDAALKDLAVSRNCQFYYTSYTGNGSLSKTITFPKKPVFLVILGNATNQCIVAIANCPNASSHGAGVAILNASWSGNRVTLSYDSHAQYMGNQLGATYHVFAILDANS